MNTIRFAVVFFLFPLLVQAETPPPPFQVSKEYSVSITHTGAGQKVKSRLFVSGNKMRTETEAAGQKNIAITRLDKNVMYSVMPAQKVYMEMPIPPGSDRLAGPPPNAKWKLLGEETVNGHKCKKYQCTSQHGGETMTALYWVSQKTGRPVRMKAGGTVTDWSNFQEDSQPASLFELPPGYRKISMPGMGR